MIAAITRTLDTTTGTVTNLSAARRVRIKVSLNPSCWWPLVAWPLNSVAVRAEPLIGLGLRQIGEDFGALLCRNQKHLGVFRRLPRVQARRAALPLRRSVIA